MGNKHASLRLSPAAKFRLLHREDAPGFINAPSLTYLSQGLDVANFLIDLMSGSSRGGGA